MSLPQASFLRPLASNHLNLNLPQKAEETGASVSCNWEAGAFFFAPVRARLVYLVCLVCLVYLVYPVYSIS